MQRPDADGRYLLAVDADLPPVAARIGRHPGNPGQERTSSPGSRGGHGTKSQAEPERPVLAIQPRRIDQPGQAGAEDQCGHHGGDRDRRPGQRAAHRHRAAAPPRLQRHPGPHRRGRRPTQGGQRRGQPRPGRWLGLPSTSPAAPTGGVPGDRRDDQHRQDGHGHQPEAEDAQIRLHARVGLGQPGGPDRHQRRRGHGNRHRDTGPSRAHHTRPQHSQPEQLPPAGPQRAQHRIVRGAGDQLPAEQLADDHQHGQPGQRGEQGQRVRLRPDRLLDLRLLISEADHLHALGAGVVARQLARPAAEARQVRPRPQPHQRLIVADRKQPALAAAEERR